VNRRDAIKAGLAGLTVTLATWYSVNFPDPVQGMAGTQKMVCYKITDTSTGIILETGMSSDKMIGVAGLLRMRKRYYDGQGISAIYDLYTVKQQRLVS